MTPDLPPLRDVIARHGLAASKALGQNFLLDGQLLDRIAAIPGDLAGASVYEVGPGPGGLTRALLRAGATVTAVERDARCLPALAELGAAFPGKLKVIEDDALSIALPDVLPEGGHIASNLPYNVGTALLVQWLSGETWPPRWQSLTLMFQREVADRIVAQPGSSAYGRLSILGQWRSTARLAMPVHRSAFTPPPKVMEQITAAAFGQRRKMLRQSLKSLPGALDALEACGIQGERRAETLSVEEFVALGRVLSSASGPQPR